MFTDEMLRAAAKCQLSDQQFNVVSAVLNTKDNLIISAVAGSGKTYTLKAVIRSINTLTPGKKILYLVFNKKNQTEMAAEIQGAEVSTFHAKGMRLLPKTHKWQIEGNKLTSILKEIDCPSSVWGTVSKLVSLAKSRAFDCPNQPSSTDNQAWLDIIDHFALEEDLLEADTDLTLDELVDLAVLYAKQAFDLSVKQAHEQGIIDFDDMLYIPVLDKAVASSDSQKYDFVLIDEAQDTSTIRRELAAKLVKSTGKLIAVGDPFQAIYGFTGADNDALDQIGQQFSAKTLPLSVSFRCPKDVIAHAQQYVNHIEAAATAKEGSVSTISHEVMLQEIVAKRDPKTAIICRYTKYLVQTCFALLKRGIACQILGKDIAAGLIKLAKKWKRVKTLDALISKLEEFKANQTDKLIKKGKEQAAANLSDQIDCLLFLIAELPRGSELSTLETQLNSMFVDNNGQLKDVVTLMTCHKSKGLEYPTVYWLGKNQFQPSSLARTDWQAQQEINLIYVTATRAQQDLIIVDVRVKEIR